MIGDLERRKGEKEMGKICHRTGEEIWKKIVWLHRRWLVYGRRSKEACMA